MDAKQTPLIDLLERVPADARMVCEHDKFHSQNIPVGRLCHEAAAALKVALAQPEQEQEPVAHYYAKHLAIAIWEKHYKDTAPDWRPLPDLMGVLTQIDNMAVGLAPPRREWRSLSEEEIDAIGKRLNAMTGINLTGYARKVARAIEQACKERNT
jgi:hypothetical protein